MRTAGVRDAAGDQGDDTRRADISADRGGTRRHGRIVAVSDMAIVAATLGSAGAMGLVRAGWGGRRPFAAIGWTVAIAALAVLASRHGAWGLAIGTLAAMAGALVLVLYAGWTSPGRATRAPREAPSVTVPRRVGDIARRVAVFALTVPVAFAAAQWLTFGAQAIARRGGAVDADAIALTLFLQPLLWAIIVTAQMTRARPAQMIAAPAVAAALGTIMWSVA